MRILFISRSTLYDQPGGDTVQVEQTADHLRQLGVGVDIQTKGFVKEFRNYDVLHFFNLGRPADILPYLVSRHPPLVTTSIYIDYSHIPRENNGLKQRLLQRYTSHFGQEYIKAIARGITAKDRLPSSRFMTKGFKKSVQEVLAKSSYVITASQAEQGLIESRFGKGSRYKHIALGTEHFKINATEVIQQEAVLCVARFEALKNQLNLIRAQARAGWPLSLVGNAARNQQEYLLRCRAEAGQNVTFHPYTKGLELQKTYAAHKVHALPSFYETTGLATLEALLSGASVVCGKGGAQEELFKGVAHFCDPTSPASIQEAVEAAMKDGAQHQTWVRENFSWAKAAHELHNIYQEISR